MYALMHVRNRVDGIGGKSSIVTIKNNSAILVDDHIIEDAEREFKKYESSQSGLLQYVVGYLSESQIDIVTTEARDIRNALKSINH